MVPLASATRLVLEDKLYSWTEPALASLGINTNKLSSSDDTNQKGLELIFIHGADLSFSFLCIWEVQNALYKRTLQFAGPGQPTVIYSEATKNDMNYC